MSSRDRVILPPGSADPVEDQIARLARDHGDALVRYAFLLTRDADDAQDAVQAVLARLLANPTRPQNLKAYARKAVLNEVQDIHRKTKRRARLGNLARRTGVEPDPAYGEIERLSVWEALGLLSERHRAVVVLHYYEDLDPAEVARILECSPATVRSILSRARNHLRHILEKENSS